jgi:NitT/TauT family transport system permease protein
LELRVLWPEFKLPAPVDVWSQIWQLVTTGKIVELFWVSVRRSARR